MSDEEGGWAYGDEDTSEFAYADYVDDDARKGKRKRDKEPSSGSTSDGDTHSIAATDNNDAAAAAAAAAAKLLPQRAALLWLPDAFRGHHCPICLEPVEDSAMIEPCRHLYCKSCLFEWLAISERCPLCKAKVTRVLHDIKSPKEYKVSHVRTESDRAGRKDAGGFASPATRGALARVYGEAGGGAASDSVSRGADFRSVVYARGLAAEPPEPKARRPKSADQLRPWIAREVQAAASKGGGRGRGAGDTRLVADVVEALLKGHDVDEQEGYCKVKEQLRDFFFEKTDLFLHELWCFRWSRVGMPAYDRAAVYNPR